MVKTVIRILVPSLKRILGHRTTITCANNGTPIDRNKYARPRQQTEITWRRRGLADFTTTTSQQLRPRIDHKSSASELAKHATRWLNTEGRKKI